MPRRLVPCLLPSARYPATLASRPPSPSFPARASAAGAPLTRSQGEPPTVLEMWCLGLRRRDNCRKEESDLHWREGPEFGGTVQGQGKPHRNRIYEIEKSEPLPLATVYIYMCMCVCVCTVYICVCVEFIYVCMCVFGPLPLATVCVCVFEPRPRRVCVCVCLSAPGLNCSTQDLHCSL